MAWLPKKCNLLRQNEVVKIDSGERSCIRSDSVSELRARMLGGISATAAVP